jgi:hypothetical protein
VNGYIFITNCQNYELLFVEFRIYFRKTQNGKQLKNALLWVFCEKSITCYCYGECNLLRVEWLEYNYPSLSIKGSICFGILNFWYGLLFLSFDFQFTFYWKVPQIAGIVILTVSVMMNVVSVGNYYWKWDNITVSRKLLDYTPFTTAFIILVCHVLLNFVQF